MYLNALNQRVNIERKICEFKESCLIIMVLTETRLKQAIMTKVFYFFIIFIINKKMSICNQKARENVPCVFS